MADEFDADFERGLAVQPGVVQAITPLVRRLTAGNPGRMTGPGTNTWIVGRQELAIVDPGPDDRAHVEELAALAAGRLRWILITHTHPDHSPGSRRLQRLTGAPILAHSRPLEGIGDPEFSADHWLQDGDTLRTNEFSLRCLHTPGHAVNHLCYLLEDEGVLLAGDQVMDGATVVIAPPDGDMQAYLSSLERLQVLDLTALAPGHGRVLQPPNAVLQRIIDHRLERERMVLAAVLEGETRIPAMVERIYTDVPSALHPVAERSVHAHLIKLAREGRVTGEAPDGLWLPANGSISGMHR